MSIFKKLFGGSSEPKDPTTVKVEKKVVIPLKNREKIQILHTISGKKYKITRNDESVGDCIDHYHYYDDNGKGMTDFVQVLWLFDNMVKSNLVDVKDHA